MKLSVIGTGYLGATHAVCMAELGHEVIAVDIDSKRVEALNAGRTPFFEPRLAEMLQRNLKEGRLEFTTDMKRVAEFANVHFLGVGTPQSSDLDRADLSQVFSAVKSLASYVQGKHYLFGKSTVPVGTCSLIQELFDSSVDAGSVEVAWNPEFLREGHAVEDTILPDRIVVGARTGSGALELASEIYNYAISRGVPFLSTDIPTAEIVKCAANAFLATKISFINAVAEVCDSAGADVVKVAEAIGYDERIGGKFLGAGVGFGGGCLPKDIRAFSSRSSELGASGLPRLLREVDEINTFSRKRFADQILSRLSQDGISNKVAVLGAAFKPDSDDIRDSPALWIANSLYNAGLDVSVYDPKAMANGKRAFPDLKFEPNVFSAAEGASSIVVATEWKEFKDLDPNVLGKIVSEKIVFDGRNCLPRPVWETAGWEYVGIGRA